MKYHKEIIPKLLSYQGFCFKNFLWLVGRLIHQNDLRAVRESDGMVDNFKQSKNRFLVKGIADQTFKLTIGENVIESQTDAFGYFTIMQNDFQSEGNNVCIFEFDKLNFSTIKRNMIYMIPEDCKKIVVSDIDDTLVHTNVRHKNRTIFNAIFGNALSKKMIEGAAPFLNHLNKELKMPIFYVSRSPYELSDVIKTFFEINDFPNGPMLLRNVSTVKYYKQRDFLKEQKFKGIEMLFKNTADIKFILIGDSSEKDALIYLNLAKRFPKKVDKIFIRNVYKNRKYKNLVTAVNDFPNGFLVQFFDGYGELGV